MQSRNRHLIVTQSHDTAAAKKAFDINTKNEVNNEIFTGTRSIFAVGEYSCCGGFGHAAALSGVAACPLVLFFGNPPLLQ